MNKSGTFTFCVVSQTLTSNYEHFVPAGIKLAFELPSELSEGTYHLIIMAQTEEGVLLNKTETVKIAVTGK